MLIIAHRGNVEGSKPDKENRPEYIMKAINMGFDVEIDVWEKDNKLFLGHDEPLYNIGREFLNQNRLWIHCKNIEVIEKLLPYSLNIFCHNKDSFTITTHEYTCVYPGKKLTRQSIAVLPETKPKWDVSIAYGICTDYPIKYKELWNQ
jgi:hypothetical protein